MFKFIQGLLPWYLRPTYAAEIVPELIKEKINPTKTPTSKKVDLDNPIAPANKQGEYKIGFEEVVYGAGVIMFLFIIQIYV